MIKTFDTNISGTSATTSGLGSTKQIITVILLITVAYFGYKFVVKPMLDKKEEAK